VAAENTVDRLDHIYMEGQLAEYMVRVPRRRSSQCALRGNVCRPQRPQLHNRTRLARCWESYGRMGH
jgi:hypothetical protein